MASCQRTVQARIELVPAAQLVRVSSSPSHIVLRKKLMQRRAGGGSVVM
jgi:hypothetical protein